ncbi:MAG: XRE family transcriptional regulator [Oscillospiraceae bacterium]|jgi:toxin-antitoxin system, antitoxin component, xre family|nr:MAG: XRE family transcriptional regulator [Oscillospiraceae bacterium]
MLQIDLAEIGNRISVERRRNNITQEQLAEKMNVSIQMISNLERGNKAIKINNLVNLSQILGVSTDYILTGNKNLNEKSALLDKLSNLSSDDYLIIETLINKLAEK